MRSLLLALLLVFFATPAWAGASVSGGNEGSTGVRWISKTRVGETDDSKSMTVGGLCLATYSGTDDVSLYSVATRDTATSSGTLIRSFTAATTTAFPFTPGQPFIKVDTDDATAGDGLLTIRCSYTQMSSGGGSTIDADGDGLYEYVLFPQDFDGDGTSWKTCECGPATEPEWTEDWLCGTQATSATVNTQISFAAGDSAGNPEECKHDGQRIWDDIGDDFAAVEPQLTDGTVVDFEAGTFVLKGSSISDTDLCWDSGTETYTQECLKDTRDAAGLSVSGIMLRHSNMVMVGRGIDPNGFLASGDLEVTGTQFVKNKGLEATWSAAVGGTIIANGGICFGFGQTAGDGWCGPAIHPSGDKASLLVGVRKGACWDDNDDGTCDSATGGDRSYIDIDTANVYCVDNSAGFVDDNMTPNSLHVMKQYGTGAQIQRFIFRVESVGAACGGSSTGKLVTAGGTPWANNEHAYVFGHPTPLELFGSESTEPEESGVGNHAEIFGPLDISRLTTNIQASDFYVSHSDFPGSGGCGDGTEAACDEGPIINVGSGFNHELSNIGFINTNSAHGSGSVINAGWYAVNWKLRDCIARYNFGGLVEVGQQSEVRGCYFADNFTAQTNTGFGGTAGAGVGHMIRVQGWGYKIYENVFERNQTILDWENALVEVNGDYGVISKNRFTQTSATCIRIAEGARMIDIEDNDFDCGMFTDDAPDGLGQKTGVAIYVRTGDDLVSGRATEGIEIVRNRFLDSKNSDENDPAPAQGGLSVRIGNDTNNTVGGGIGPAGINFIGNWVYQSSSLSYFAGVRGGNDPDMSRIFFDGNHFVGGGNLIGYALDALGTAAVSGTAMDSDDDGLGLPKCGTNWFDGVPYSSFGYSAGRQWPQQCIGVGMPNYPWSPMAAASTPDCDLVRQGTVVSLVDDTAVGACTDAGADGQLDGGGTAISTCVCDAATTWSAL